MPAPKLLNKAGQCLLVPLAILFFALANPAAVSADGPISYWKLDETGGNTFIDSAGTQNGGCATACPSPTNDGQINGGQVFSNTAGINVPASGAYDWGSNDSFSIEVWVKGMPGQTCATTDQIIVGRTDPDNRPRWSLGCSASTGQAIFQLTDSDGISATLESTKTITTGVWHHLVGVRDSGSTTTRLYVDGVEADSTNTAYAGGFYSAEALDIGHLSSTAHFDGVIDEVALHAEALSQTTIVTHYYLSREYANVCAAGDIAIMPLGDSNTRGSGGDGTFPRKGYRKPLYLSLTGGGFDVDFVGNESEGGGDFDSEHQGISGVTAVIVAANVHNWLLNNPADVVLLHIGTNDLNVYTPTIAVKHVSDILDEIDRFSVSTTVVLARIINRAAYDPNTSQFNQELADMSSGRIANGDKIVVVDQESALSYPGDLFDNLHPNATGYDKMADVWLAALDDFLPLCALHAPAISSTPITTATVGALYSYDVEATGSPVPTYTLAAGPAGMSIDETTGLIEWTPSMSGLVQVEVAAVNSEGSDQQNFTVKVGEALSCPAEMKAYRTLDEANGPVYADFYDGHDGTCIGSCPTSTIGKVNGGQSFNGSDTRIDVPAHPDFNWGANDSFSLELWMKGNTGTCANTSEVMIGRDDPSGTQWWLGCSKTIASPKFQLRDNLGFGPAVEGPAAINDGNWHHLVAVRDAGSALNRLYVDGTEVASVTHTYTESFSSTTAALNIGWFNHRSTPGFYYEGVLDEIATYNRALSRVEIQQHYSQGLAGQNFCEALETPAISSTPVTTATAGIPYSYDVEATGYPAPSYALITSTVGMTIEASTGVISWTPAMTGSYEVGVQASNVAGSDTQTFLVTVEGGDSEGGEPYVPTNPTPVNGAIGVSINPTLTWSGGHSTSRVVTYTVAFGTNSTPAIVATTAVTSYTPPSLQEDTRYYWFITATDGVTQTVGSTWSFTTEVNSVFPTSGIYLPIVAK